MTKKSVRKLPQHQKAPGFRREMNGLFGLSVRGFGTPRGVSHCGASDTREKPRTSARGGSLFKLASFPFVVSLITIFLFILPITVILIGLKSLRSPESLEQIPEMLAQEVTFSEEFEGDLSQWEITSGGGSTAAISSEQAQSGSKSLKLHYDGANSPIVRHRFSSPQQGTLTVWFFDNMDSSIGTFAGIFNATEDQVVLLGVRTSSFPSTYSYRAAANVTTNDVNSQVPRSYGWHKFEFVSTPQGSYGKIDGTNLSGIASNTNLASFSQIKFASTWALANDAYFDNLQLQEPTPTPQCTPGERRCVDNKEQTCNAQGQWEDTRICVAEETCSINGCQSHDTSPPEKFGERVVFDLNSVNKIYGHFINNHYNVLTIPPPRSAIQIDGSIITIKQKGGIVIDNPLKNDLFYRVEVELEDTGSQSLTAELTLLNKLWQDGDSEGLSTGINTNQSRSTYWYDYTNFTGNTQAKSKFVKRRSGTIKIEFYVTPAGIYPVVDGANFGSFPNLSTGSYGSYTYQNPPPINFIVLKKFDNGSQTATFKNLKIIKLDNSIQSVEDINAHFIKRAVEKNIDRSLLTLRVYDYYFGTNHQSEVQQSFSDNFIPNTTQLIDQNIGRYGKEPTLQINHSFINSIQFRTFMVWAISDYLTPDQLNQIQYQFARVADKIMEYLKTDGSFPAQTQYGNDTFAEEISWILHFLTGYYLNFPNDTQPSFNGAPRSELILDYLTFLGFHHMSDNRTIQEVYGNNVNFKYLGSNFKNFRSQYIHSDGKLDNHYFHPSLHYALGVVGTAANIRNALASQGIMISTISYNLDKVYQKSVKDYLNPQQLRLNQYVPWKGSIVEDIYEYSADGSIAKFGPRTKPSLFEDWATREPNYDVPENYGDYALADVFARNVYYLNYPIGGNLFCERGTLGVPGPCTTSGHWHTNHLNYATMATLFSKRSNFLNSKPTPPISTPTQTPTPIPTCPPPPSALSASCPAPGTTAIVSWNPVSGASYYSLRVDDKSNNWSGTCDWNYPGDVCFDRSGTSYSFAATPGHTYDWWLHSRGSDGCWSDPVSSSFSCQVPPTPTPTKILTPTSTPTIAPGPTYPGCSPGDLLTNPELNGTSGWHFWNAGNTTGYGSGGKLILQTAGSGSGGWSQNITTNLRNKRVRLSGSLAKSVVMADDPYLSINAHKDDGSKIDNYGGPLFSSSSVGVFEVVSKEIDIGPDVNWIEIGFPIWSAPASTSYADWISLCEVLPTPTPTSTRTPTPIPQASLNFRIKFQGISSSQASGKNVRVIFKQGAQERYRFDSVGLVHEGGGVYRGTINNVSPGTYDVLIKGWAHLQRKFNLTLASGGNSQNWSGTLLLAGDIDFNGRITNLDLGRVLDDYWPDTPPNSPADLNLDGKVSALDLGPVLDNYFEEDEK